MNTKKTLFIPVKLCNEVEMVISLSEKGIKEGLPL